MHNFQRKRLCAFPTLNRKKQWWLQSSGIWRRVSWRKKWNSNIITDLFGISDNNRKISLSADRSSRRGPNKLNLFTLAFITNPSYVHVSSLEGFFLLGKEERCHQTTTFRNWSPSNVPVRHFEEHLTIPIFNSGCHWLLYGAERHVRARDFSFLSSPPPPKSPY